MKFDTVNTVPVVVFQELRKFLIYQIWLKSKPAVLQVEVVPQLVDKSAHANIAVGSFPIGFSNGHHEAGGT